MVHAYILNVLVITNRKFLDCLKDLENVLQKLVEAGLKVNAEKSFFGCTETEYIGFWVFRYGVRALSSKVDLIKSI